MVKQEQEGPIVWGYSNPKLVREELGDNPVNVTQQVVTTPGEWVGVETLKGVPV